ncbi:hypothetical protein NVP1210O_21 [Vibrio phage 1.210.O._10N.222.52.C2]|nr:hypothetical protein NVP1210O_21 [Vibrio phage 1.210.O._10N.222.52.C2]
MATSTPHADIIGNVVNEDFKAMCKLQADAIDKQAEQIKLLREALSRIAIWQDLSLTQRVNIGSNGDRDHYRALARKTLNETGGSNG